MESNRQFTGQEAITICQRSCVSDGQGMSRVLTLRMTSPPSRASLRPVHPKDGNEHAQEQGHLQEDQEQEVKAAEQTPRLWAGTGGVSSGGAGPSLHRQQGRSHGACDNVKVRA